MARSPLQRCEHYVPGLRSTPWWDPDEVPIVRVLEHNYPAILEEFDDFVLAGSLMLHPQSAGALARTWLTAIGASWTSGPLPGSTRRTPCALR